MQDSCNWGAIGGLDGKTYPRRATRAGHSHAPEMMEDDLQALTESGGIELVVAAIGDLLEGILGSQEAVVEAMRGHRVDPSATHFAVSLFATLAKASGYDGQRALDEQARRSAEAEAYGHLADAIKQRDDKQQP